MWSPEELNALDAQEKAAEQCETDLVITRNVLRAVMSCVSEMHVYTLAGRHEEARRIAADSEVVFEAANKLLRGQA